MGLGAVALAVSAAFGGLSRAADEIPQVSPGTPIEAGQFRVVIDRAVAVKDLKPTFQPDEGGALIAVVATLTVTDDKGTRPDAALLRLLDVPGVDPDAAPLGTVNLRDSTVSPVLQPEQAETVAYIWKLPKATELPAEVTVSVLRREHVEESSFDGYEKWREDGPAAETRVAVKDNTKQAAR